MPAGMSTEKHMVGGACISSSPRSKQLVSYGGIEFWLVGNWFLWLMSSSAGDFEM